MATLAAVASPGVDTAAVRGAHRLLSFSTLINVLSAALTGPARLTDAAHPGVAAAATSTVTHRGAVVSVVRVAACSAGSSVFIKLVSSIAGAEKPTICVVATLLTRVVVGRALINIFTAHILVIIYCLPVSQTTAADWITILIGVANAIAIAVKKITSVIVCFLWHACLSI